jgi:hypothetical protein
LYIYCFYSIYNQYWLPKHYDLFPAVCPHLGSHGAIPSPSQQNVTSTHLSTLTMSNPPPIMTGKPTIFFDSHPERQESFLGSYLSSLKSTLYTAFTGDVTKFHPPGQLRVIWWTNDGTRGIKDYDLHKYALVRDNFYALEAMKEVTRVIVMGYPGQNPYMLDEVEKFGKHGKGWEHKEIGPEEKRRRKEKADEMMNQTAEGRNGKLIDIEAVIEKSDEIEERKMREKREKKWEESDGLMSGEMV